MDTIRLPILPAGCHPAEAHRLVKTAQVSAAIVRRPDVPQLVRVEDIVSASRRGDVDLSGVSTVPVHSPDPAEVAHFQLDQVAPFNSVAAYEALFKTIGGDYVLASEAPEHATIVTRSEGIAFRISTPRGYYCTGEVVHGYPPPTVVVGQACPQCNSTVEQDT